MGSRFNCFFADQFGTTGINRIEPYDVAELKKALRPHLKCATEVYKKRTISLEIRDYKEDRASYPERYTDEPPPNYEEWQFEGYSGDFACCGTVIVCKDWEFEVNKQWMKLIEKGNHDLCFPYEDDYFAAIREVVENRCSKFTSSLAVKINGRWAIVGFYPD